MPDGWRPAFLVPNYKGRGDQADASSYRPLSVPTVACRLWSAITNAKLMALTADQLPAKIGRSGCPSSGTSVPWFLRLYRRRCSVTVSKVVDDNYLGHSS